LHVTGAAVVPDSEYHVAQLPSSCAGAEETCDSVAGELSIATAAFGDVDPITDDLVVLDVARVVDHIKGVPGSLSKAGVHLRPNVPDALGANVGVLDVATAVDALTGRPYGFAGDFGPCTDSCPGETPCP
jgi:hypothetical protein